MLNEAYPDNKEADVQYVAVPTQFLQPFVPTKSS